MPIETWRTAGADEVSVKAKHLLRILRNLWKRHGRCFPKLTTLTEWMIRDGYVSDCKYAARSVQRYLAELVRNGLIQVEKRGQNFYYPAMSPDDKLSSNVSSRVSSSLSSSPLQENCIYSRDETAAASTPKDPSTEAAISALRKIRIPSQELEQAEASLVVEVDAFLREAELKDPVSAARSILSNPEKWRFHRDAAGHWHRPDSPKPAGAAGFLDPIVAFVAKGDQ